jgi:hypothetical protein
MAIDTSAPHSRRALLAASLGAVATSVLHAFGRPDPARAGVDGDVVLGTSNESTSVTSITNTSGGPALQGVGTGSGTGIVGSSSSGDGVEGFSTSAAAVFGKTDSSSAPAVLGQAAGGGIGVQGYVGTSFPSREGGVGIYGSGPSRGVRGVSDSVGVRGESTAGNGVEGISNSGRGVWGATVSGQAVFGEGQSGVGVYGTSIGDVGVRGISFSSSGAGVRGEGDLRGVEGFSPQFGVAGFGDIAGLGGEGPIGVQGHDTTASGTGVRGLSLGGVGVRAESASGTGLLGQAFNAGVGVVGYSGPGAVPSPVTRTGVYAASTSPGTALETRGPVRFSTATIATIQAGANSTSISPGIDLTPASKVLCTLLSDPGARSIRYVSVDAAANTYTVHLTGKATGPIAVACFLID